MTGSRVVDEWIFGELGVVIAEGRIVGILQSIRTVRTVVFMTESGSKFEGEYNSCWPDGYSILCFVVRYAQ